jgi:hypothetical protein
MEFWMLLLVAAFAWLIAPIILFIALIVTRGKLKSLQAQARTPAPDVPGSLPTAELSAGGQRQALIDLENLVLLRLELQRQVQAENLDETRHRQLSEQIDGIWGRHLVAAQATPNSETWQRRRQIAWNLLARLAIEPPGAPPWQSAPSTPVQAPLPALPGTSPAARSETGPVAIPPPVVSPVSSVPSVAARTPISRPPLLKEYAADWQPAEPSPFERLLQRVSGWPQLAVPFLLQNIGWFIGAFCLLAGTVFLVRNTSGFWLALVVFVSMLAYTGLLLWAGYQLRARRPELVIAGSVLLGTSLLLAPLDLAAAARLIAAADAPLLLSISLLLTGVALAAFYWAASLVSPLMDRSLAGLHPRLVVVLAALQLAAPLLSAALHWLWLAVLHGLLLGVLGYGLRVFTRRWVRAWFVDRRRTAYYAGGVLVYAAVVSFVHLTWVFPGPLPAGYFGPFLMALSGLLFQVDAAFKDWFVKFPVLSRFSFGLYGLSALAAVLGLAEVVPGIITLALGAGLYGWVTWRYLTLPPLYLMLACLSGAYGLLVLEPLAYDLYLLASLPGLFGLAGLIRWAQTRSRTLARQCSAVTAVLLAGLTGWSLVWAQPGWVGLATPVIASAALYWLSRRFIAPLDPLSPRLEMGVWSLVTVLATAAAFYAPPWPLSGRYLQIAFLCVALAALWTWSGLRGLRRFPQRVPVFLLSAWLNVMLALAIGVMPWDMSLTRQPWLIPLLLAGGGVWLWQSLVLRRRALFYAVLLCWGGAGALVKLIYFPSPGTGLSQFLLVLPLWALLWWLNARFPGDAVDPMRVRELQDTAAVRPLVRFFEPQPLRPAAVVREPLGQAMALLWLIGLAQLALGLDRGLPFSWPWSAALGALASVVVLGYFQRLTWIAPVPLLLALGAVLGWLTQLDATSLFCPAAALFAWLAWWSGMRLLEQPLTRRLANAWHFLPAYPPGNRRQRVEWGLYGFTIGVTALVPPLALLAGLVDGTVYASLPALAISLGCFAASGWYYRSRIHSYAVLVTLTIAVWLVDALRQTPLWIGVGQPSANALLSLALAGGAWVLEYRAPASRRVSELYRGPLNRTAVALAVLAAGYAALYTLLIAGWSRLAIADGVVLLAAGGALLLANLDLARFRWGFLGVFLVTLACYGLILLGWIGEPGSVYSGSVLAVLAFAEAGLADYLDLRDGRWTLYGKPLYAVAGLAFGAGLIVAGAGFLAEDTRLPILLVLLSVALLPLLSPLATAPFWRSIGVILLLSGAFHSLAPGQNAGHVMLWGYGLWLVGNALLPGLNARYGGWALDAAPWPWFGLAAVLLATPAGLMSPNATLFALGLAAYLLLMIRHSAWAGFPWSAVAALTLAGLLLGNPQTAVATVDPWSLLAAVGRLITLLWLNLILLMVPLWRRYGPALVVRWRWRRDDLEQPLFWLPFAVLLIFLAQWVTAAWLWLQGADYWAEPFVLPLLSAAALTLSLAHACWIQPGWLQAHALLTALFALLPTLISGFSGSPSLLPPLSAVAYGLVLLAWRYRVVRHPTGALEQWTVVAPALTGLLLFLPGSDWTMRAVTLAVLAFVTGAQGWWKGQRAWLALAMALPLAAGYAGLAAWTTTGWIPVLPWAALQTMLYAWVLLALHAWLERRPEGTVRVEDFQQVLGEALLGLPYLPVVLLATHTLLLFGSLLLYPTQEPSWLFGRQADAAAAIAAFVLLLGLTAYWAWRNPDRADWVYVTALLGLLLLSHVRLIALGPTPFTVLDSSVLIALAFVTVVIQRLTGSLPVQHVALGLPLLALLILPPLQAAWHGDWTALSALDGTERLSTSSVLLAMAVLYIALSEALRNPLSVYLGVLALNAGIYLWVPQWARSSGLWQWYVIPAAVTVLALLHWHRRELRPAVLNGGRLAALSVLYASVGADVLRPQNGLGVFVLALGVNLLGVAVGIALRIRAFLYTGVAFLVLNVGGQLLQYYPEQGLARALVLIGVGVVITVGMVGFNIKREAIMQRLRIIRADLADWA